MNLDFGILWIEDSFNEGEQASFERRVREAGFIARVENIPNGEGIEELARQNQLFHRYDLILLDYKLKDEYGDELAPKVRELFPATAILFYSGTIDESKLRTLIANKKVEGVFCSHRNRFIDRAGSLIDQTAKSLNRLSGMRGLAMRVVAECDDIMKEAVRSISNRNSKCAGKITELDHAVLTFADKKKAEYEDAMSGTLEDRLNTFAVDSSKLHAHFRLLTKEVAKKPNDFGIENETADRLRELRRDSRGYHDQVLQKRNDLGHVVEIETDTGWKLQGKGEISIEDFPSLRGVFASHLNAFREIAWIVTTLDRE